MSLYLLDGLDDDAAAGGTSAGTAGLGRTGKGRGAIGYPIATAAQSDTMTLGFACRIASFATMSVINLAGPSLNVQWNTNTNRRLQFTVPAGVQLTSPDLLLPLNTWFYLEAQVKLDNTVGFVTTRLNGVVVPSLTATGIDTLSAAPAIVTNAAFESNGGGIDDVYIMTGSGDSFLGDIIVETLYPNGNGAASAWVGSDLDSTDNYLHLDETPPLTTDWIGASTMGAQNLYTVADAVATGTVLGVCHQIVGQRTDATARNVKALTRSGGTTNAGTALPLGTSFGPLHHAMTVNPVTGLAFTNAEINALEIGVEVA